MSDDLHVELHKASARVKYDAVASAIGKDVSTVSRIFSEDTGVKLRDIEMFLCALGFKVVPLDAVTVDGTEYHLLVQMAAKFYADRAAQIQKAKE